MSPIVFWLCVLCGGVWAENKSSAKCGLPVNIEQLPLFAQEEVRAVWKNYVPGDDCSKELLITDDILTVLDMFDKELGKTSPTPLAEPVTLAEPATPVASALSDDQIVEHQTLIPSPDEASSVTATLQLQTESPIRQRSPDSPEEEEIDYSDFTTTSTATTTAATTTTTEAAQSSEVPFTFTEIPTAATNRVELDYVEPKEQPLAEFHSFTTTIRPIRITKVHIPKDYDTTEPQPQRISQTKSPKPRKAAFDERFYESLEPSMPFLKGANEAVVRLFHEVMRDPEHINEQRRQEEIHLLAVSYLNARQLSAFNSWSAERRKRIRAREQMLQPLSYVARDTLKQLSLSADADPQRRVNSLPSDIRQELRAFALRLRADPDYRRLRHL